MLLVLMGMSAQTIVRKVAFQGTLNGKTAVRLAFEVNADGIAAGEIYYPKAKHPAPILVVGSKNQDGSYSLTEYTNQGEITGEMRVAVEGGRMTGEWTNPRTEKYLTFTNMKSIAFPKSCGGKLIPEDPGKIGHEYSYTFYHSGMEAMMGGHVSFRAAGKNRVHFHVSNVPGNIAEGKSEEGRPAVLHGNQFIYEEVNECGYGFKALFFPKFVVLSTVTDWETTSCFGAHTAFDAVYVKVKD